MVSSIAFLSRLRSITISGVFRSTSFFVFFCMSFPISLVSSFFIDSVVSMPDVSQRLSSFFRRLSESLTPMWNVSYSRSCISFSIFFEICGRFSKRPSHTQHVAFSVLIVLFLKVSSLKLAGWIFSSSCSACIARMRRTALPRSLFVQPDRSCANCRPRQLSQTYPVFSILLAMSIICMLSHIIYTLNSAQ